VTRDAWPCSAEIGFSSAILASVPDLPFRVPPSLGPAVLAALDREGKLDRALEALGPLGGRDVVAIDPGTVQEARWSAAGARVIAVPSLSDDAARGLPAGSADVIVSPWAGFRGVDPEEIAEADRLLRPGGRLLVIHDYGRDDVATLRGDQPEYGAWTRRDGPFLTNGFRVRVLHCFWTFDDLDTARALVAEAFGDAGRRFASELRRPRLAWNVAVYHRTRAGAFSPAA
jgi:SAM-dependent methyltransferase